MPHYTKPQFLNHLVQLSRTHIQHSYDSQHYVREHTYMYNYYSLVQYWQLPLRTVFVLDPTIKTNVFEASNLLLNEALILQFKLLSRACIKSCASKKDSNNYLYSIYAIVLLHHNLLTNLPQYTFLFYIKSY